MSLFSAQSSLSASPEGTSLSRDTRHHTVVVIGGGTAGLTVAAELLAKDPSLDVAIVEPSDKHYYQPAWTLVGGGRYAVADTVRSEQDYLPAGAKWIRDRVAEVQAEDNRLELESGSMVTYNYLVMAPGIQIDWGAIRGLPEALGKGGVCSNYSFTTAPYTWECIQRFQGGTAIFTHPATPIKCGGAPQKIMYMADDTWRSGLGQVRDNAQVLFCTAQSTLFSVPAYTASLQRVVERRDIRVKYKHNLVEIRPESREAVFEVTGPADKERVVIVYDFLHVTPPMSAPDFLKRSSLAVPGAAGGWVDVHKHTLQHNRYPNVFALGDAAGLPISKTAAAIRMQAPVVVENLLSLKQHDSLTGYYSGYTCCPLITGYGTVIMAEFDYRNQPISTFPIDPTQESFPMWVMKRHVLPWVYWNRMIKGKPHESVILQRLGLSRLGSS